MEKIMDWLMNEVVAAAEIVAVEGMAFTNFLYEEGEIVAEFVMQTAVWLNGVVLRVAGLSEF